MSTVVVRLVEIDVVDTEGAVGGPIVLSAEVTRRKGLLWATPKGRAWSLPIDETGMPRNASDWAFRVHPDDVHLLEGV